ncbi:MAG: ABC transporter permease subunit [Metamycoplasmataceae bacterium]
MFLTSFEKIKNYLSLDKQKQGRKTLYSTLWSLFFALIITIVLLAFAGVDNPFTFFTALFNISFNTSAGFTRFFFWLSIFIFATLAISICFRIKIFNISISSSILLSSLFSLIIINNNPTEGSVFLALIVSILTSIIVSLIITILKIYFKINEVISSIMLNLVILNLSIVIMRNVPFILSSTNINATVGLVITNLFISTTDFIWLILTFSILTAILFWFIIKKTTIGFKLDVIKNSNDVAKYAGINEKKTIIYTMIFSGILAGIAGFLYIIFGRSLSLSNEPLSIGFDTIAVTLLANNNPIGIVFSSFFYSILTVNPDAIPSQLNNQINREFYQIIIGILIYFTAIITVFNKLELWTKIKQNFFLYSKKEGWENYSNYSKEKVKFLKLFFSSFSFKKSFKELHPNHDYFSFKKEWKNIKNDFHYNKKNLKNNYFDSYIENLNKIENKNKERNDNKNENIIILYLSKFLQKKEKLIEIEKKIIEVKKYNFVKKELVKNNEKIKVNINYLSNQDKILYYKELSNINKEKDKNLTEAFYFIKKELRIKALNNFKNAKKDFKKEREELIEHFYKNSKIYKKFSKKQKDTKENEGGLNV